MMSSVLIPSASALTLSLNLEDFLDEVTSLFPMNQSRAGDANAPWPFDLVFQG